MNKQVRYLSHLDFVDAINRSVAIYYADNDREAFKVRQRILWEMIETHGRDFSELVSRAVAPRMPYTPLSTEPSYKQEG